jgi:hypothetical protein
MQLLSTILHVTVNDTGIVGNSWSFILSGIKHIIPLGWDHILFLTGLFLSTRHLRKIVRLATAFTVAHSITLILCASQLLPSKPQLIEPIIGLTIALIGLQNLIGEKNNKVSYLILFVFGLIHGCGFATALGESGIPQNYFYSSLISFNIGIELAQIAIIAVMYFATRIIKNEIHYKKFVTTPVSLIILAAGIFLTTERLVN